MCHAYRPFDPGFRVGGTKASPVLAIQNAQTCQHFYIPKNCESSDSFYSIHHHPIPGPPDGFPELNKVMPRIPRTNNDTRLGERMKQW